MGPLALLYHQKMSDEGAGGLVPVARLFRILLRGGDITLSVIFRYLVIDCINLKTYQSRHPQKNYGCQSQELV